jgi:hypothetical protein
LWVSFHAKQAYDQAEREQLRAQGVWNLVELERWDEQTEAAQDGAVREEREPRPGMHVWVRAVHRDVLRASGISRELLKRVVREQAVPMSSPEPGIHRTRVHVVLDTRRRVIQCTAFGTDALERGRANFRPMGEVAVPLPEHPEGAG